MAIFCFATTAHAQAGQTVGAQVAELQFALARSLAQAGEHEAAAREFDRAFALQRQADSTPPAQTSAALQTLRAYVQSRPELPRIGEIGRRLELTERQLSSPAVLIPNAPLVVAPTPAAPMLVPNAPPSPPPVAERRGARSAAVPPRTTSGDRSPHRAWWDEATLSADELLVPAEWVTAGMQGARRPGTWPQLLTGWPALLVPPGWDRPSGRPGTMLLAETELLVPVGW